MNSRRPQLFHGHVEFFTRLQLDIRGDASGLHVQDAPEHMASLWVMARRSSQHDFLRGNDTSYRCPPENKAEAARPLLTQPPKSAGDISTLLVVTRLC